VGRARQKHLLRFLADHPTCCFCGGETPATTFDHVPPKSLFTRSRWPEGYRFPACWLCNNSTSAIDQIVGALARMNRVSDPNDPRAAETDAVIREFVRRYPRLALSLKKVPARVVRKAIRDGVIERQPGRTLVEHPILSVPPELYKMLQLFGAKLALAFHYKHANRIVPKDASIVVRCYSNVQAMTGQIPPEILAISTQAPPTLRREGHVLVDQFDYRYAVGAAGEMGTYTIAIGKMFLIVGLIMWRHHVPEEEPDGGAVVRPFGREPYRPNGSQ
jgi:hypothetical protein